MNDSEIKALWVYAQQLWRTFEIPADGDVQEVKLLAWRRNLGDLTMSDVQTALDALDGGEWPPSVGAIREQAFALRARAAGEERVPDVDEAWGEVVTAFGQVGRYATPAWSHPAIASTVKAIGWVEMCNSTDQGVLRGQFARLYGVCRDRTERDAVPLAPAVERFIADGLASSGRAALMLKRVDDVLDGDGAGAGR